MIQKTLFFPPSFLFGGTRVDKGGYTLNQPDRKGPGGSPGGNKNMMGIVSIILWALIITLMINYFTSTMSTSHSQQIEFSQFLEMV